MMEPMTAARNVTSFGPFGLDASRRLLEKDGTELGARTLDILIELLSRPNEVVSKNDLLARVWPDVIVEEGSLRFHIVSPHKALGLQSHLRSQGYRVPFIFITAVPDEAVRRHAFKDGAMCFLTTRFDEDTLISCLTTVVELHRNGTNS